MRWIWCHLLALGLCGDPHFGGIAPSWVFRLIPLCLLTPVSVVTHQSLLISRSLVWLVLVGVGLLDTAAILLSFVGLATGHVAVVGTLTSLYSVATLVLAWIFLKERLRWSQWVGILLILGGVAILSA